MVVVLPWRRRPAEVTRTEPRPRYVADFPPVPLINLFTELFAQRTFYELGKHGIYPDASHSTCINLQSVQGESITVRAGNSHETYWTYQLDFSTDPTGSRITCWFNESDAPAAIRWPDPRWLDDDVSLVVSIFNGHFESR